MTPRLITWITLLQLMVILLGVCITGFLVKLFNSVAGGMPGAEFPPLARDYGLWLVPVSLAWALIASYFSRRPHTPSYIGAIVTVSAWLLLMVLCLGAAVALFTALYQLGLRA